MWQSKTNTITCIAFKFEKIGTYNNFLNTCNSINIIISCDDECVATTAFMHDINIPDVADPIVQEYILQLLFDDSFPSFVNNVANLLNQIKDRTH